MGYHSVAPLREAPGASLRNLTDRRLRRRSRAWALGMLLPLAATSLADDLSQTLTTRETLRQQEREQRLWPRPPDARIEPPAPSGEPERLPTNELPCFEITRIELAGEEAERFQWALAAAWARAVSTC